MKRILTVTTALTLMAAPVFADTKMDLVRYAQQTLNDSGITYDADALSMAQLAEIKAIDTDDMSGKIAQLEQIVGVSASAGGADLDVAVPALNVDVPESDVVQSILDDYDIAVDANRLSDEKKAEILSLDVTDANTTKLQLETIIFG